MSHSGNNRDDTDECAKGYTSAPPSKNAVSAIIKQSRYFHLKSNFTLIHSHAKRLYIHMIDIVDAAFSYERELIVCSFLQISSKVKGSSLYFI